MTGRIEDAYMAKVSHREVGLITTKCFNIAEVLVRPGIQLQVVAECVTKDTSSGRIEVFKGNDSQVHQKTNKRGVRGTAFRRSGGRSLLL